MRNKAASAILLAIVASAIVGTMLTWFDLVPKTGEAQSVVKRDPFDAEVVPLARIPPGTTIDDRAPEGFSHLIFKNRSELASGDLDSVPLWSAELARVFFTALLARVKSPDPGAKGSYRLEEVAIGIGTRIGKRDVIISSATQQQLGADLGLIKRLILARAEERLAEVRRIARSDSMIVFDAPQVMLIEGRHRLVLFRYTVLVEPADGKIATVVWRIDLGRDGSYELACRDAVLLRPNLLATCALRVDKREVTAGIPSSLAFATTRLPNGDRFELPKSLLGIAGQKRLTASIAARLEAALREEIAALRR